MKHTLVRCLVLAVLALVLPVAAPHPTNSHAQTDDYPFLEWIEGCEFDLPFLVPNTEIVDDTVECGYLVTLENPSDPNSAELSIAFAILYANSGTLSSDPIVYLEGGPGGSAILGMDVWVESPLRQNRDVILVDQRGTGYSWPSLSCYEYLDDYDIVEDAAECIAALEDEGVDLGHYNTVNNAADVGQLMELLVVDNDYTSYNLIGVSYGTRLALAIMRDHPALVRSAVLDAVYPAGIDAYAEQALNLQYALYELFDACASDSACNAAYPDLETAFYDAVALLDAEPAEYEDGELYDGLAFVNELYDAFADTLMIPALPAIITLYAEGDYETGDAYFLDGIHIDDSDLIDYEAYYDGYDADAIDEYFDIYDLYSDAEAMFMAMECQEEYYYNDYDDAVAFAAANNIDAVLADSQLISIESLEAECQLWTDTPAPVVEDQPVSSTIPTLLVSGQFDTLTPPAWADYAAATLPNSYHYIFPGYGHGVIDGDDCVVTVYQSFLDNPNTPPAASCIDSLDVDWVIVD